MNVGELIEQMREDYLDDDQQPFLWKRSTLLRYLSRAQEQACMRQPLIVDAGTPVDGASVSLCEVTLVTGQLSYPLSDRVVLVNSVTYDDVLLTKHTESELDRCSPGWRLREGAISGYLQNDLTLTLVEAPTVVD
ncbi:MAG: hypothetical protein KDJ24_19735, partial [Gammaproteobacteria bacterium]|nr:hypothetical protein [Gammaproteobacteria bacterium]